MSQFSKGYSTEYLQGTRAREQCGESVKPDIYKALLTKAPFVANIILNWQ